MEQDTGVEPAFTAWEAVVLPIYESCMWGYYNKPENRIQAFFVAGFRLWILESHTERDSIAVSSSWKHMELATGYLHLDRFESPPI